METNSIVAENHKSILYYGTFYNGKVANILTDSVELTKGYSIDNIISTVYLYGKIIGKGWVFILNSFMEIKNSLTVGRRPGRDR